VIFISLEKNKALVRKGIVALNKKDLSVLDEFMAKDYIDHINQLYSREEVKQLYMGTFNDYPDFKRTIEDIIAEGVWVWGLKFNLSLILSMG
jgi:predicted ester cyclase